jgi:hypothetical protein
MILIPIAFFLPVFLQADQLNCASSSTMPKRGHQAAATPEKDAGGGSSGTDSLAAALAAERGGGPAEGCQQP